MNSAQLTPARLARLQQLFEQALDRRAEERDAFLADVTGDDIVLRDEVLALLAAHARSDTALSSPIRITLDEEDEATRWVGLRVGPWQVTQRIGYGGMGTVCEAVRADDHYRKRVAIKFLHRFAAGPDAVRRFKAERQMLATLDHPNVAALIDGGVTDDGHPYLVMEYVDGAPITQWCQERKLPLRAKVKLFLQVCAAVEAAHRNLIVHRDLKPANILVTNEGQVKLLDFGIARLLTSAEDPNAPPQTLAAQRSFTPDYAAPEQVRGQIVGTPADVYALGVVLFEMLAGNRPYDLRSRSFLEIERTVCETAAPRARINEDIDAILQMALRKEPQRRYGGVAQLSTDLRNYLDGRPVTAQPDSLAYRVRKLVRRRKLESAAVAIATLSLLTGLIVALLQAQRAQAQSQRAEQVTLFLTTMLGAANPDSLGKDVKVREVLDDAAERAATLGDTPDLEAEVRSIIGDTYVALGEYGLGEVQFKHALAAQRKLTPQGSSSIAFTLSRISHAQEYAGRYADANATLQEKNTVIARFPFADPSDQSDHLDQQGRILIRLGRVKEAEPYFEGALDALLPTKPSDDWLSVAYANLGYVKSELGKNSEALTFYSKSVAAARRAFGSDDPQLAEKLSPYATTLGRVGQWDQAGEIFVETLRIRRKALGPEHPEYAKTLTNYADHLVRRRRFVEAVPLAREVLALRAKTLPDSNAVLRLAMSVLARALEQLGEVAEAEQLLNECLALNRKHLPEGHWIITSVENMLGGNLVLARRYAEAEPILLATEAKLVEIRGESAPVVVDARQRLVDLYTAWSKPESAAHWQEKIPASAVAP